MSAKEWAERSQPKNAFTLQDLQRLEARTQEVLRQESRTEEKPSSKQQNATTRISFAQARERMSRTQHDRTWWERRYNRIVRAGSGYYFFDAGYWYPAFGYDPALDTYAYDGPIFALGDLTLEQEIAGVQRILQADGYYAGPINGLLDATTLQAIAKFQNDNGLSATGAIDQPTVEALGMQ